MLYTKKIDIFANLYFTTINISLIFSSRIFNDVDLYRKDLEIDSYESRICN